MLEDDQRYKMRFGKVLNVKNSILRKVFIFIWHLMIFVVIALVILFWHSSIFLIGCEGDFSRMVDKIVVLLFVLFLTSPLFDVLRKRLFPKISAPRM